MMADLHPSDLSISCFPAVTHFNNGLEASSDSDDEDKLHIVEDDSLQEQDVADADRTTPLDSHDDTRTVLLHNGSWNGGETDDPPPAFLELAPQQNFYL